jgi:hypothetical protein
MPVSLAVSSLLLSSLSATFPLSFLEELPRKKKNKTKTKEWKSERVSYLQVLLCCAPN